MASQMPLEDSGTFYERIWVNIRDPDERAQYFEIDPKGQVPAISIDGELTTEASAVITAISQLVPEKHYTGRDKLEMVRFYE